MLRALLILALILVGGDARAATRLFPNIFQGATVGTSSEVIVGPGSVLTNPPGPIAAFLYLENVGAGTICIAFAATATISSGACAPGELTLQPGAFRFFDTAVPTDMVSAVASAAGVGLTVGAQ